MRWSVVIEAPLGVVEVVINLVVEVDVLRRGDVGAVEAHFDRDVVRKAVVHAEAEVAGDALAAKRGGASGLGSARWGSVCKGKFLSRRCVAAARPPLSRPPDTRLFRRAREVLREALSVCFGGT